MQVGPRLPILVPPVYHTVLRFKIGRVLPIRRAIVLAAACILTTAIFATAGALAQVPPVGATADVRDATGRNVATG